MRFALAGAVLAIATTTGFAQPPSLWGVSLSPVTAKPADAALIQSLIADLASTDFRTRERSGKTLAAHGDRILPQLRDALKTVTDAEARRRLEVIVEKITTNRLVTARRVTLRVQDKSAKDIVAELARQSGYTIQYNGNDKLRYSFNLVDVPFWEGLDKLCDAAGLNLYMQNDDGTISLSQNDTVNPFVAYSGPFRIVATNINSGRNLQLSNLQRAVPLPRQAEYLGLSFGIYSEPKAPIIGVGQAIVTKAIDDTGNSLMTDEDANQSQSFYPPQLYGYRSFNQGLSVGLYRPNPKSTVVKELAGKVTVVMLSEVRPEITIENILDVKKKTFPGRTLDLEVVSTDYQNDALTIEMTLKRRSGDADDYNWINWATQRLEVADAKGEKFQFNGVNEQVVGTNSVTIKAVFSPHTSGGKKAGKPARLRYLEWVTVSKDVTFVFKDIPMP